MIIHLINKKCIRIFANNKQIRDRKDEEEVYRRAGEDSPFAKAMGHPARIAILQFLLSQERCFSVTFMKNFPLQRPRYRSI